MFLEREYSQIIRLICEMLEEDGKSEEATMRI